MTAYNPNGNIDFLQCNDDTVSHFPVVGLQQIFARCAGRAEPGPIVEDSPVAEALFAAEMNFWSTCSTERMKSETRCLVSSGMFSNCRWIPEGLLAITLLSTVPIFSISMATAAPSATAWFEPSVRNSRPPDEMSTIVPRNT